MKTNPALEVLARAVGTWAVTGTHPLLPNATVSGRVTFEPIEQGAFIRMHSKMDDARFPEGVAIFGTDDGNGTCSMLYFDERGVARTYDVAWHEDGFTWSREAPAPQFAQRFRVTIATDGQSMQSVGTMKKHGADWEPDLSMSYVRV